MLYLFVNPLTMWLTLGTFVGFVNRDGDPLEWVEGTSTIRTSRPVRGASIILPLPR